MEANSSSIFLYFLGINTETSPTTHVAVNSETRWTLRSIPSKGRELDKQEYIRVIQSLVTFFFVNEAWFSRCLNRKEISWYRIVRDPSTLFYPRDNCDLLNNKDMVLNDTITIQGLGFRAQEQVDELFLAWQQLRAILAVDKPTIEKC